MISLADCDSSDGDEITHSSDTSKKRHDLKRLLQEFDITALFDKFCDGNVTTSVLWELDEEILDDIGLSKLEKLKYRKAKEEWKKKTQKEEVKSHKKIKTKNVGVEDGAYGAANYDVHPISDISGNKERRFIHNNSCV